MPMDGSRSSRSPTVPSSDRGRAGRLPACWARSIQQPPAYSALKIKGQRAYDLARAGQAVELAPRLVRIDRIAVLRYAWPHLELEIDCGSGTYIRSIARDIGEALGCGGLVETLVRTRIGPFTLEQAVDPADLSTESIDRHLRPALDAVADLPRLVLDARSGRSRRPGPAADRRETCGESAHPRRPGRTARFRRASWSPWASSIPTRGWVQPRKVLDLSCRIATGDDAAARPGSASRRTSSDGRVDRNNITEPTVDLADVVQ